MRSTLPEALRRAVPITLWVLAGCGGGGATNPDLRFGETAIVVVVNPQVNVGNTTAVPSAIGPNRAGLLVDAEPGGQATTDPTGVGVVVPVAPGSVSLGFPRGATLPFSIAANGDVYDLAVAHDGGAVVAFPNFPIRYAIGGQVMRFDTTASSQDIGAALSTRDTVVFVRNGTFVGNLEITGDNVLFFGEGFTQRQVVIDGSVVVRGTGVRIRGFTITGDLTVNGNDFGMSFSVVRGRTDIRGNAVAFLRNAFCGEVTVPSSNASLLDNEGMAPLPRAAAPVCP